MVRSFLEIDELSSDELSLIFDKIRKHKNSIKKRKTLNILKNRIVGLLFEKPSTRTRVSFEAAAQRLGGSAIYLSSRELQLKRGEPIEDTARILGSYLDILVSRVYSHQEVEELAQHAGIPIINGLSDLAHPTQIVCDLFTILEAKKRLDGLKLAYIGDGNNICNSLLLGCALAGVNITAACPAGHGPEQKLIDKARTLGAVEIKIVDDPSKAALEADILYADVWVSMGEEKEKEEKLKVFQGYQINSEILKSAKNDAVVMHCLPAYRGEEITEEVIEGPQSIVWQQGANKMYGAAGILDFFLTR